MAPRQPIISRTDSHDTSRSSTQSFDSHSISMAPSEPTSDERPDLGAAFSTVIRELAYMMQPPLREVVMRHNAQMRDAATEDSEEGQTHDSYTYTPSAFERARRGANSSIMQEEEANNSTVWDNRRIASYLASHTPSFTPSQTEPEYTMGDVSSYPHSTPRTLLQSAFLAKHSSPIGESFTPADDHDAYSSFPHQAYEHHDYHSSIINDWESRQLATTMPYIESRSQSQNPSSRNAGDLEEGRAVEIRDTLSSLRSNSLPSSTPDREALPSPPPSAPREAFSPTDYSSSIVNIRLRVDPVSATPDFPPSASEIPLSTFDYLGPTIRSIRPLRRSESDDIVNDVSEDPLSVRVPSFDLRSQNLLSSPRSSSSRQSSSIQRSTGPSPQGSSGEAYFRDDSETVPIASSIDSGVLSRNEDEDEYSEDEEAREQRRHTAALRHIVRSGGLDLVREESTEGGVRHEVIRPLILREDSSASDLVLPIVYSGHTKQGSGASGVSSSGSTLSSRNNTLSGSLTISGNGTLHFPSPRMPYTPSAYREGRTSGGNEGGFYRTYNDLNSVSCAPDSTFEELVDEYRQVNISGDASTPFDPDGSFDDDVEYPPESESQSGVEDLEYVEERDSLLDDVSNGRPNGNVYIGGRDSVMARSLPNLRRGEPDEDEPNEHPHIRGDVEKQGPHVSLVHTSPNPNPSLGYLDAALAYLAAEKEKVTKGRSTGIGKDMGAVPLDSKGKEKEREHFDDLVDDDENVREQDFRSGGLGILGISGSGGLSDSGKDSRKGWRDILEPRRRSRRKRNDSPSNSTHKSKSSRASTTSTAATILPPGSSWSRANFTTTEHTPSGSKTPKSSKSKDNTRSPAKTPYNKPSLEVDTTTSPSSPLSSLNLSIRLPSFVTALTPTGTLTSGGENVRAYGIFGHRDRKDDEDVDSTKANGKGKSKDKGKGSRDERSPKGKKSSKISIPHILKRPAIPFQSATSATSLEDPDEKLDLDATPVMASAPFFSEPVTPSRRRLLAHSRVEMLHSAPVPVATASDQEQYTLSSDADESSGSGGDDADDDFHTTGTEGFGSHSDRIPIHRAKSAEGYDWGALEGQSWQQRLLNEQKSRQENKRSRKSSQVRSGGRNSEHIPIKDFAGQRGSHFPDVSSTSFPINGLDIRDGQQGTNPPKSSKVAKKANHKRHSSDFGRPGNAGKRSLLHARSSPLLRPSEILAGSDPGHSGAIEGQTRPKPQSQPVANLDKFDAHRGSSLSDADTRRITQLRVLGQKLRKAFPEDVRSLDQIAILGARKGRKSITDSRGSGKENTKGSGQDSDRFGQHEGLGEGGSRKRKRSRTRTRRRKVGNAEFVDGVDGVDDADDAGDEDEEEEILWGGGFIDTRGPLPNANDPPVHIFIDHSNILFGLLNYLRRHPRPFLPTTKQFTKHLSHAALTLLLERGRPIAKRVMVASSPLYQPMEGALRLGYEVHIFKRVPHDDPPANAATDGSDRQPNSVSVQKDKGHRRQISESTSTESDQASFPRGFLRNNGGGKPRLLTNNSAKVSGSSQSSFVGNRSSLQPQKIRYREQGVDELLQLKLSQVLLRTEAPIPGSTIVLATGDGNAGQFNEEGFVEPVRIALQRGWKVELYAWEDGLSRTWRREFGDSSRSSSKKGVSKGKGGEEDSSEVRPDDKGYGDRFRIIGMERFGGELVEADGWDLGTVASSSTTD